MTQKRYKIELYLQWQTNSRIWFIERRYFQWLWTTPIPGFKVTTFFDAEYLLNDAKYRHSFNGILIGTYTRHTHCRLDYCNSALAGVAKVYLEKLQSVQNMAARMVSGVRWSERITPVHEDLHWLPVSQRV